MGLEPFFPFTGARGASRLPQRDKMPPEIKKIATDTFFMMSEAGFQPDWNRQHLIRLLVKA